MNSSDPSQTSISVGTQSSTPINDVASPTSFDEETVNAHQTADAIHNAFMMGWSLQELKSDVLLGALDLPQSAYTSNLATKTSPSPSGWIDMVLQTAVASTSPVTSQPQGQLNDSYGSIARTSAWRANFIRIATVHDQCFPLSTTENTPYDPSPTSRFPFLYPSTPPDYALIGISNSGSIGIGNFNSEEHLGNFKLYDVTRRALNCLTLLYTQPEETTT